MLGDPELNTVLHMGSHKSRAEEENHLLCSANHTYFDEESYGREKTENRMMITKEPWLTLAVQSR